MYFTRRKFISLSSKAFILPLMGPIPHITNSRDSGEIQLSEEALKIHRYALVLDGHNDMPGNILDKGLNTLKDFSLNKAQPQLQTDIPRLRKGGVDAQVFVAYISPDHMRTGGGNQAALEQIELIHSLASTHSDHLELASTPEQIRAIASAGKIAAMVGVEGGHAIENSLKNLERYRELGACYMTLTHNENTDWADASYDSPRHGGLSKFGEKVIEAMNGMGMLADVSHAADDTVRDVIRVSKAPVIASHSSVKAICPSRRNLTDELIKGIAGTGGIVMINFFPLFLHPEGGPIEQAWIDQSIALRARKLSPEQHRAEMDAWQKKQAPMPQCYVGQLVDHIDHVVKLVGIDHVGLGSDYDGITYGPVQMPDVSGFPYVTQELLNRGYIVADIQKILGQNFLRVLSS